MKRLSPEARSMLAEYRSEHALEPGERQRMAHALQQRLASGPPALELDPRPPPLPLDTIAPRTLTRHAKLAGVALGIGLASVAALRSAHVQHERPQRAAASPATTSAPRAEAPPLTAATTMPPSAAAPIVEPRPEANSAGEQTAPNLARVTDRSRARAESREPTPARDAQRIHTPALPVTPIAAQAEIAEATTFEPATPSHRPSASASAEAAADRQPAPETLAPQRTTIMVDDELALLRSAQSALRAGDPKRALVQLAEHRWRFPDGQLADSRAVARMLALCANGDRELARAEASRFLAAHPRSPFAQRVRSICAEPER